MSELDKFVLFYLAFLKLEFKPEYDANFITYYFQSEYKIFLRMIMMYMT